MLIYKDLKRISDAIEVYLKVRQLVILSRFSLPALKKREEEKENELTKPVLKKCFSDPFDFHLFKG